MVKNNSYCRLCLCKLEMTSSTHVLSTRKNQNSASAGLTLIEQINSVFPFKITKFDGLSMVVCAFCEKQVVEMYEFVDSAVKNQKELKRKVDMEENDLIDLIEIPVMIKEEYAYEQIEFLDEDQDLHPTDVKPLSRKKEEPPGLRTYECDFCAEKFSSKFKLEEHIYDHVPDAERLFTCIECRDKFFTYNQMRRHMAADHPKKGTVKVSKILPRYLLCYLCPDRENFDRFEEMVEHIEYEHGTRGYGSCCERKFYTRKAFTTHVDTHVNAEDYLCTICDKKLPHKRSHREHMARHQPESEKRFQCEKCDKKFYMPSDLKRHMVHNHDKDPDYVARCDQCNKTFTTKGSLHMHNRRFHMDIEMPMCETCGKTCRSKSDLKSHIKARHTETERSKCHICGNLVKDLKRHLKYHYEASLNIRCEICNHQTNTYKYLRLHMKTHSDERPFQCAQCGQGFKRKKGLDDHMSIHTGIPKHFCNYCDRSFNNSGNKFKHIKQAHPVEAALHGKRPGKLQGAPIDAIKASTAE